MIETQNLAAKIDDTTRHWSTIKAFSVLLFLITFFTALDGTAQSRFRSFTAETVGGRALHFQEGVAEFHRDKRYVWTSFKGKKEAGEWWLVGGLGQHSNMIRVKFQNGKIVDFHVLEENNIFYLMRQDTGRYVDNRKFRIKAIKPI